MLPPAPAPTGPVLSVSDAEMVPSVTGGIALGADPGRGVDIALALLGAATVAIILLAIGRLAVLATDLRQLRRLRQVAARVDDPAPRQALRELAEQIGVRQPVELLEGPPDSTPMTFGAWRPVIMVPRALMGSPESLAAVLAHELMHIRRADYSWALIDFLVSAAFAFHPLVWVLRRGIERCREMSCDAEVLARGFVRHKPYAELLAHTHAPTQFPMYAVAATLSAPSLKLKERLETLKHFAHKKLTSRQRVGIVLGAGLVCLVVAMAGACATRTDGESRALLEHPYDLQVLAEYAPALADRAEARRQVGVSVSSRMRMAGLWIGMAWTVSDAAEPVREAGRWPRVSRIRPCSPAHFARLQPGDELLSVNGRDTRHGAPFPPGSEGTRYAVKVERQGTGVLTLRLQLARRPTKVLEPVSEAPIPSPADWNCPALDLG